MFKRNGNYIGDSDPDAEEQFDPCSICCQMFEINTEGEDGTCFSCIEKEGVEKEGVEIEKEEYNSDRRLKNDSLN